MKYQNPKSELIILSAVVMMIAALVIGAVVFSAKKQDRKQEHPKDWLTSIPRTMSKVKDLEIVNPRIVRAGTEAPGVAFEIRNNSPRGVTAISITCGGPRISKDGLEDEENPVVIIEPYSTLAAEMNDELTRDAPIVIDAATFTDGKEEGTETTLKFIHKIRERERARHKAEKERKAKPKP